MLGLGETPPHLLQLISNKYVEVLNSKVAAGQLTAEDVAVHLKHIQPFLQWGHGYLADNRPMQLLNGYESNYGIVLTNQDTFLVSPAMEAMHGTMQRTGQSVSMTRPSTMRQVRPDIMGTGSIPMDGKQHPVPEPTAAVQALGYYNAQRGMQQDLSKPPAVNKDMTQPQYPGY